MVDNGFTVNVRTTVGTELTACAESNSVSGIQLGQWVAICHQIENTSMVAFDEYTLEETITSIALKNAIRDVASTTVLPGETRTIITLVQVEESATFDFDWTVRNGTFEATAGDSVTINVLESTLFLPVIIR